MRESVLRLTAATADEMRALGARLAAALGAADVREPFVIGLSGDLGAGKTTFVGGLLAALGHDGPTRSPTYTLIEPYRLAGRDLYHCDLYRLRDPSELDDLGLRDLLVGSAVVLVEWPERAAGRLPTLDLALLLEYENQGRALTLVPGSDAGRTVVAGLRLDPA